jgi:Cu2+-exporting ATPase
VRDGAERQFCCAGCATAWEILHSHGLDQYYRLPEQRSVAVGSSTRSYEEFDHPSFHDLHVRGLTGGLSRVVLLLEGIHCASCVWLVERVPMLVPGVTRAELDVRRALVTLEWDATATPLSTVARTLASLGYSPHPFVGGARESLRRREERAALVRIGIAGAIAVNVMLAALASYTSFFGQGLDASFERFFRWLSLGLVVPAILGPGRVFFRSAWASLRARTLHLDLPIAIALGVGFVRGAINTVRDSGPVYLDGIAVLIFLLLVGRYLQQRWQRAATDASELLHSLTPNGARVVDENETREVPAGAITPGMLLDVRAGDTLAADGIIESGRTTLDMAWLTGESRPVAAAVGDEVLAGTINVTAPVRVRVTRSGEETRVARVLQQVEEGASRRAPVVLLANRLAGVFVAAVLTLSIVTWAIWRTLDPNAAIDHAIALLIVTCPCALAMATPLSVTVALGRAARRGIFVKGGDALQVLAGHGTLLLDKTGTITEGRSALVHWEGPDAVRPMVLALEQGSLHPIAAGFRTAWPEVTAAATTSVEHTSGGGIAGLVEGHRVAIGSPAFVQAALATPVRHGSAMSVTDSEGDVTHRRQAPSVMSLEQRGHLPAGGASPHALSGQAAGAGVAFVAASLTPVHIAVDGELVATAGFGDPVRADSRDAVAALSARGWSVGMLSGDAPGVCLAVGSQVGIARDHVQGGATPELKAAAVSATRVRGEVVMVGDGVNDAAAMATASVGIAVHGGAEAALASSDAYLTRPGLQPLVEVIDGARRTMRVVKRNVLFSLAYNLVGIGLAMTGRLDPIVAALMMPLSSLTVVAGSWYGRTFDREAPHT